MTPRNQNLNGKEWSNGEYLISKELNDTFNGMYMFRQMMTNNRDPYTQIVSVPIGGIIGWHKNLPGTPELNSSSGVVSSFETGMEGWTELIQGTPNSYGRTQEWASDGVWSYKLNAHGDTTNVNSASLQRVTNFNKIIFDIHISGFNPQVRILNMDTSTELLRIGSFGISPGNNIELDVPLGVTIAFVPTGGFNNSTVAYVDNIRMLGINNWVECNGGTVNDVESPINGQTIPSLNGTTNSNKRFLYGGTTYGTTGGATSHSHSFTNPGDRGNTGSQRPRLLLSTTINATSNIPMSMDVVFIMRIK